MAESKKPSKKTTTTRKKAVKRAKRETPSKKSETKTGSKKPVIIWAAFIIGIIILAGFIYGYFYYSRYEPLAEFDGGKITKEEFVETLKVDAAKYDPVVWKNPNESFKIKRSILQELIKERLLLHEAKKRNITVTKKELETELNSYKSGYTENTFREMLKSKGISYEAWTRKKKNKYLIQKSIQQAVIDKIEISDKAIKEYYIENPEEFQHPERVRARHILVNSWEEAEKILKELKEGANFASVAKKKSISPERWKGGDLGYFAKGTKPEIFDKICFSLPEGKISPIVKSEYGYHIFKVIDKKEPVKENLDDAKDYIITKLQQQRIKPAFDKWYRGIYDNASVKINDELLKQIEVATDEGVEHEN